jgi:glutamate-1-semialdehyde 2,1-aminomutase
MTAGKVAMELMTPEAFDRLNRMGAMFGGAFEQAIRKARLGASMTIAGSLFRIHMKPVIPRGYREGYPSSIEKQALGAFHAALMRHGVFISPYGLACVSSATAETDLALVSSAVYEAASEVVGQFPALEKPTATASPSAS